MTDNTPQPAESKPRERLTPRHGWYKLWRADIARIRELGERDDVSISCPVLIAVWSALSDIANEKNSTTFDATIGIIRSRAGVSRRTAFDALKVLESLGLVARNQNKNADNSHLDANTWTIFPSVKLPSANAALGKRRTTPSANESLKNSHRGIKNSPKGGNREENNSSDQDGSAPEAQPSGQTVVPKKKIIGNL